MLDQLNDQVDPSYLQTEPTFGKGSTVKIEQEERSNRMQVKPKFQTNLDETQGKDGPVAIKFSEPSEDDIQPSSSLI